MKIVRFTRKTGLQKPFNGMQILSWFVTSFTLLSTFLVILPTLNLAGKVLSI